MYKRKYVFYLQKIWKAWLQGGFGFASKMVAGHILRNSVSLNEPRYMWERMWVRDLRQRSELTVVEIGVYFGNHAEYILKKLDIKQLYLIDPYESYGANQREGDRPRMSSVEQEARARLENHAEVTFIKKYSSDALDSIPDQVDLVYIDGNHAYEYVRDDIANYNHLVKRGGMLVGHDYAWPFPGVIYAVEEFNQETKSKLQLDLHGDWWFLFD